MELRHLIEAGFSLFDFDYVIDPEWKPELEEKIIDYYYFREIGMETAERFQHYFRTRIQSIMPYYNKLYVELKDKDYLVNEIITNQEIENYTGERNQDTNTNNTGESELKSSDYPQNIGITNSNIDRATDETNTLETNLDDLIEEEYIKTNNKEQTTNKLTYMDLVKEFNLELSNLEQRVINSLEDCFTLVYNA